MGREDGPRERTGNRKLGLVSSSQPCGLRSPGMDSGRWGARTFPRGGTAPPALRPSGTTWRTSRAVLRGQAARLLLALRPCRLRCVHVSEGVRVGPVVVGGETSPGCEGAGTDAQTLSSRGRRAHRDDLKGPRSPREQSEDGPPLPLPADVSLHQPVSEARAAGQLGPSACGGPESSPQC